MTVLVALAGALGAVLRYVVATLVPDVGPDGVPRGTTVVNLSGSLLAGLVVGAFSVGGLSPEVYAAALAGFCGGYTTFSSASVEAVQLLRAGRAGRAAAYVVGTLAGTVAVAALGVVAARWLLG